MSMPHISRRRFLYTGAAVTAAALASPRRTLAANSRLKIASIGLGGMGWNDVRALGRQHEIAALCDVDENHLARAASAFPEAKTYIDARELFAAGGIDAVHIATPDHTHAPLAMLAMQRGLHVYCQKPLTHSVHEARELADAAAKYKVVTQMGNQHRSGTRMRLARHFVEQGVIGTVREVHAWTDRPIWPQ